MAEIGGVVVVCCHTIVVAMWVFHGGPLWLLWVSRNGSAELSWWMLCSGSAVPV